MSACWRPCSAPPTEGVILVTDALCSSADETHDSMMNIYMNRFGQQVECVATETLLGSWPGSTKTRLVS
ncbi:hypothetical protein ABIF64_000637 [Bradyrhizobium japonicum]|uniref:Isochorismatase-like domain-containing protein n=1 Tax=Bradyrhizobium japonicum TaxID=375 RepID=A0ABV2RLS7_BRAJP